MNFLHQGFRKLSSDKHTYTGGRTRPKLYTTPLRGWSRPCLALLYMTN